MHSIPSSAIKAIAAIVIATSSAAFVAPTVTTNRSAGQHSVFAVALGQQKMNESDILDYDGVLSIPIIMAPEELSLHYIRTGLHLQIPDTVVPVKFR